MPFFSQSIHQPILGFSHPEWPPQCPSENEWFGQPNLFDWHVDLQLHCYDRYLHGYHSDWSCNQSTRAEEGPRSWLYWYAVDLVILWLALVVLSIFLYHNILHIHEPLIHFVACQTLGLHQYSPLPHDIYCSWVPFYLYPPCSISWMFISSHSHPLASLYFLYIVYKSKAKRPASCPPAPARISRMAEDWSSLLKWRENGIKYLCSGAVIRSAFSYNSFSFWLHSSYSSLANCFSSASCSVLRIFRSSDWYCSWF